MNTAGPNRVTGRDESSGSSFVGDNGENTDVNTRGRLGIPRGGMQAEVAEFRP